MHKACILQHCDWIQLWSSVIVNIHWNPNWFSQVSLEGSAATQTAMALHEPHSPGAAGSPQPHRLLFRGCTDRNQPHSPFSSMLCCFLYSLFNVCAVAQVSDPGTGLCSYHRSLAGHAYWLSHPSGPICLSRASGPICLLTVLGSSYTVCGIWGVVYACAHSSLPLRTHNPGRCCLERTHCCSAWVSVGSTCICWELRCCY